MDHVILNQGQVTWTTPELAPPLLTTTPHQLEDVSALDRFNVHRCPTRRVFSGIAGDIEDTSSELHNEECDEEDVEAWMACDAENCGFQMLNDDEIVTSVQEESYPVDDETDEKKKNNESSKGP
ncbi:uncharacterized protein TNCV_1158011 [Trichonephila clavipes]|nr:uncharacterized protein TNCV_1158011 [Trichonephila clavipes]